jgi:hypothetical protein
MLSQPERQNEQDTRKQETIPKGSLDRIEGLLRSPLGANERVALEGCDDHDDKKPILSAFIDMAKGPHHRRIMAGGAHEK